MVAHVAFKINFYGTKNWVVQRVLDFSSEVDFSSDDQDVKNLKVTRFDHDNFSVLFHPLSLTYQMK